MEDKKDLARILMNRAPEPTKMLKSPESIEYAERGGNFQYASDRANRIKVILGGRASEDP